MKNSTSKFLLCAVLLLSIFGCKPAAVQEIHSPDPEKVTSDSISRVGESGSDKTEAAPKNDAKETDNEVILTFIQKKLFSQDEWKGLAPAARRYAAAWFDLNGDGSRELLLTIPTSDFCGSGGCDLWVLTERGKLISKTTVVDFPIGISTEKTEGWWDLFSYSNGEDHVLTFDGAGYSANASTAEVVSASERQSLTQTEVLKDPFADYLGF
jgi:hypothetical protein